MLVELLRLGGIDLVRRWVAALLVVPREDREGVVASIERRIIDLYASNPADDEPVSGAVRVEAPRRGAEGRSDRARPIQPTEASSGGDPAPGLGLASDEPGTARSAPHKKAKPASRRGKRTK